MRYIKIILIALLLHQSVWLVAQDPHTESGLKKGIVQEVEQVSSYTYLNVLEEGTKKWLAVPSIEAKIGETFYYKGGMIMPNFESTELNRTFDEVVFLSKITKADAINMEKGMVDPNTVVEEKEPAKKPTLERLEMNIEPVDGTITIAQLFENSEQYNGKIVKIKGEVTKFNGGIMGRNWVHYQDGSIYDGKYDLMITTKAEPAIGAVVIFEGVITLNKDFGSGYFYDILMEDAISIQ
jgi:hypothetical protein